MLRLGITGANGFVGRALRKDAAEAKWEVVCVVRSGSVDDLASDQNFRTIENPWSPTAWTRVFEDVDVVVHLISRAHRVGERVDAHDSYYRDNVLVSEALVEGLAPTLVKKVVYLSSIKAVGERTTSSPIDVGTLPAPTTPYGQTKLEAEERFVRWAAEALRSLVVLRPPLVYGPGVKGNFWSLLQIADSGAPLPIRSIRNKRSMIFLGNLNDAILAGASDDVLGIHRLPIADTEVLSTAEVVRVLRVSMGRPPRTFSLPKRVLAAMARAGGVEEKFRRISEDLVVDGRVATEELGWTPRKHAIEALIETARWYKELGR